MKKSGIIPKILLGLTVLGSLLSAREMITPKDCIDEANHKKHNSGLITVNPFKTPIEMYSPKEINSEKKNALVITTRGYNNYVMGVNYTEGRFEDNINKLKNDFNTYVALVDCPKDFYRAHELAKQKLNGKIDLFYEEGHGSPNGLMLSMNWGFGKENLERKLSGYYNKGARGLINACSTASDDIDENFAQSLANATGIPIEGGIISIGAGTHLTEDYHLQEAWSTKKGFDKERNSGYFESFDGNRYGIHVSDDSTYKVFSCPVDNGFKLPKDFDPKKIFHYDTETPSKKNFKTVYPKDYKVKD